MPNERSTRSLIAVILFVLALFVAINYLIEQRPFGDWWLPLLLFGGGALLSISGRQRTSGEAAPTPAARVYEVRDYTFATPAPAPALVGPEQPGEVNVREPVDEEKAQEPFIPAPETQTPPSEPETEEEAPQEEAAPEEAVISAPETLTPPAEPEEAPKGAAQIYSAEAAVQAAPEVVDHTDEQVVDDLNMAGEFAPPASAEAALNPPTESDSVPGAVVQNAAPPQTKDPARSEMPLSEVQVETPARSQEERLREDEALLQPQDTAENEFQGGEHVAARMPTQNAPHATVTTGEGFGEGIEPMEPTQKTVLDKMSAPVQPTDAEALAEPTRPDVADAVLSEQAAPEVADGIAPSGTVSTTAAAAEATRTTPDDLTVISGIGKKMATALKNAGIDTFTKLAGATDEDLREAISRAGMRFAPSLSTWRQQAGFLARGDRAGFEALLNSMKEQDE